MFARRLLLLENIARGLMKAATLTSPQNVRQRPLRIAELPTPEPKPGQVLLRVRACGVCRTDLHIVEGDLPPRRPGIIPGHQIVGEVVAGPTNDLPAGTRVGVSWMGGTDGTCRYCRLGLENLCDVPTFTGYTVDGGYAEYAVVRSDFTFPLPDQLDDLHAAPLLWLTLAAALLTAAGLAALRRRDIG